MTQKQATQILPDISQKSNMRPDENVGERVGVAIEESPPTVGGAVNTSNAPETSVGADGRVPVDANIGAPYEGPTSDRSNGASSASAAQTVPGGTVVGAMNHVANIAGSTNEGDGSGSPTQEVCKGSNGQPDGGRSPTVDDTTLSPRVENGPRKPSGGDVSGQSSSAPVSQMGQQMHT